MPDVAGELGQTAKNLIGPIKNPRGNGLVDMAANAATDTAVSLVTEPVRLGYRLLLEPTGKLAINTVKEGVRLALNTTLLALRSIPFIPVPGRSSPASLYDVRLNTNGTAGQPLISFAPPENVPRPDRAGGGPR